MQIEEDNLLNKEEKDLFNPFKDTEEYKELIKLKTLQKQQESTKEIYIHEPSLVSDESLNGNDFVDNDYLIRDEMNYLDPNYFKD